MDLSPDGTLDGVSVDGVLRLNVTGNADDLTTAPPAQ
jgi:hypothetical protein